MNAEVEIQTGEATAVLLIPNNSVVMPPDAEPAALTLGLDAEAVSEENMPRMGSMPGMGNMFAGGGRGGGDGARPEGGRPDGGRPGGDDGFRIARRVDDVASAEIADASLQWFRKLSRGAHPVHEMCGTTAPRNLQTVE